MIADGIGRQIVDFEEPLKFIDEHFEFVKIFCHGIKQAGNNLRLAQNSTASDRDWETTDTISDQLIPWLSRYYGIYMPALFDKASPEQYLDGKNVRLDRIKTTALQTVQNAIWRRIFSDLPYLFSTRGTLASLYAILNNVGITPNGPVRIRELGGS